MNDTRGFAVEQGPDGLQHGPVSPESEAHGRFNAYTHLWSSIAHAEARAAGGDDPIDIALIAPPEHDGTYASLVVGYDLEVGTHISVLRQDALNGRAGAVGSRVLRRRIAHCTSSCTSIAV